MQQTKRGSDPWGGDTLTARRRWLAVVGASLATATVWSQTTRRPRRVGLTFSSDPEMSRPYLDAFVRGMHEQGMNLERDYVVEVRHALGRADRFPIMIAELLSADVDVLVVGANSAAWAAKSATLKVPIVMATSQGPETTGLVESLSRPGGNITGLATLSASLTAKRLQLLRELLPGASRIVYLTNPKVPGYALTVREVEDAARLLALRPTVAEASNVEEIERALTTVAARRPDALLVSSALVFWPHRKRIVDVCAQHRIPTSFSGSEAVIDGGLISYAPSLKDSYTRSAAFVARIFRGANPAELPIEQPTRYELFINKKTADALGITIPHSLLLSADVVIE